MNFNDDDTNGWLNRPKPAAIPPLNPIPPAELLGQSSASGSSTDNTSIPETNEDLPLYETPILSEEKAVTSGETAEESVPDETEVVKVGHQEEEDAVPPPGDEETSNDEDGDGLDVAFPADVVSFFGPDMDLVDRILTKRMEQIGAEQLDTRVRTPGTWENLVFRMISQDEFSFEEFRARSFLGTMDKEEIANTSSVLRDPESNKVLLKNTIWGARPIPEGDRKVYSGREAIMAFESSDAGSEKSSGGHRVLLYNSGLVLDLLVPTGLDLHTLFINITGQEVELGSRHGAHYFTHADHFYKTEIIKFIEPLIVNCNFNNWRKNGSLWSVMKAPDLNVLLMSVIASCYRDGYENFKVPCTNINPVDGTALCGNVDTITANINDMIRTRWPVIPEACIEFMAKARVQPNAKHNISEIAKYQSDLGLEGRKVTVGNITFTMRIPTVAEHLADGAQFLAEIENEIAADNTNGRYTAVGLRYIRTLVPWISSIEKVSSGGGIAETAEIKVIQRMLEKLDNELDDNFLRNELLKFINETQLTYIGYPSLECSKCKHHFDTPSGMMTVDPFSTFFTLASQYSGIMNS